MSILYQLSRPWAYLLIRAEGKAWFDWCIPVVLAVLTAIVIRAPSVGVNFWSAGGVVASLTGFIQNLPGFFIAALAAVATFDKAGLDHLMPEPTPKLYIKERGVSLWLSMTRRRFLCALFAFLTAQSLTITLLGIGSVGLSSWLVGVPYLVEYRHIVSSIGVFLYALIVWQMMVVTFLGLYYLGERIHETC